MELKEINPLPKRCIECEEKAKIYFAANITEQLKMEREEDINFDCGCCDYALDRFSINKDN